MTLPPVINKDIDYAAGFAEEDWEKPVSRFITRHPGHKTGTDQGAHAGSRRKTLPPGGMHDFDYGAMSEEIHAKASAEVDRIQPLLEGLAKEHGGKMEGLQYKLKDPGARMQDKLKEYATDFSKRGELKKDPLEAREQVKAQLKDGLRYTQVFPEDGYSAAANAVVGSMNQRGNKLLKRPLNAWEGKDPSYRGGLNMAFRSRSGQVFELQIHTEASFRVKEVLNHKAYEQARTPGVNPSLRQKLIMQMSIPWNNVPVPRGAKGLFKGNPPTYRSLQSWLSRQS